MRLIFWILNKKSFLKIKQLFQQKLFCFINFEKIKIKNKNFKENEDFINFFLKVIKFKQNC